MASTNGPIEVGYTHFVDHKPPDFLAMVSATMSEEKAKELAEFAKAAPSGASADAILAAWRARLVPSAPVTQQVVKAVDTPATTTTPVVNASTPVNTVQAAPSDPTRPQAGTGYVPQAATAQATPEEDHSPWFYNAFKGAIRTGMNIASAPLELVTGGYAAAVGAATGRNHMGEDAQSWNDVFETTSLWQQIGHWDNQGSGFFNGGEAAKAQEAERQNVLYSTNAQGEQVSASLGSEAADVLLGKNGTRSTPAVEAAANAFLPKIIFDQTAGRAFLHGQHTTAHQFASVFVDTGVAIGLDPLTLATLGASATPKRIGTLGKATGVGMLSKAGRAARTGEADAFVASRAELLARASAGSKADAIKAVVDADDATRAALKEAIEQEDKLAAANKGVALSKEQLNAATNRIAMKETARLLEIDDAKEARKAALKDALNSELARLASEAEANGHSLDDSVDSLFKTVAKIAGDQKAALDTEKALSVDGLREVLNQNRARLGDDIADALEEARNSSVAQPGSGVYHARAVSSKFMTDEALTAASKAKAADEAVQASTQTKLAVEAINDAENALRAIAMRRSLALHRGDEALVQQLAGDEAELVARVRMVGVEGHESTEAARKIGTLNRIGALRKAAAKATQRHGPRLPDEVHGLYDSVTDAEQLAEAQRLAGHAASDKAIMGQLHDLLGQRSAALEEANAARYAGTDAAMDATAAEVKLAEQEALRSSKAAVAKSQQAVDKARSHFEKVRSIREEEAAAASKAAAEAEAAMKESAKRAIAKAKLLEDAYGLNDEVARLLDGDSAPLRDMLKADLGLADMQGFDYAKFQKGLFGGKGAFIVKALAAEDKPERIWRAMGRNYADVAEKLATAKTEPEVLDVLAKAMGASGGFTGPIDGIGMKLWRNTIPRDTGAFAKLITGNRMDEAAFRTYNASKRIVPWATQLNIEDTNSIVTALDDWLAMAFGGPLTRARAGRADMREITDKVLRKVMQAEDPFTRRQAVYEGLSTAVGELAAELGIPKDHKFTQSLLKKIADAHRTTEKGIGQGSDFFSVASQLMPTGDTTLNGVDLWDKTIPRHLYQLSEFFQLPDLREVQRIVKAGRKWTGDNAPLSKLESMEEWLTYHVDRVFRVAALVFRPAYIIRNAAEALIRSYLNGNLQNPVSLFAMTMCHSKDRKFLSQLNEFSHDVRGNNFNTYGAVAKKGEIPLAGAAVDEAEQGMRANLYRAHAINDAGYYRGVLGQQGVLLNQGARGYPEAWQRMLGTLHADAVTQDVVSFAAGRPSKRLTDFAKGGEVTKDTVVDYYVNGPGSKIFRRLAIERPNHYGQMLDAAKRTDVDQLRTALATGDWKIDPDAMKQLLFDHELSFSASAERYLAADPTLIEAWLNGDNKLMTGRLRELAENADRDVCPPIWSSLSLGADMEAKSLFTRAADTFFHYSAVGEGALNFAPETRVTYWKTIEEYFPFLTKEDQAKVMEAAEQSLKPLRVGGKAWGADKAKRMFARMQDVASDDSKAGAITLDEAHAIAAQKATKETAELFYDGYKRKQHWYALRLAFPFGQAWSNTLATWTKLAMTARGSIRVLALTKAYKALSGRDNGEYYMDDAEWQQKKAELLSDPTQHSFIYKDPITGTTVVDVPLVGRITKMIGAPSSAVMPISSMNVATGSGMPLPGVGPVITIPWKTLTNLTDMEKYTPKWVDSWVEPFPSGYQQGPTKMIYESMMPAWGRRVMAAVDPQVGDSEIQAMQPQLMTYLTSAHKDRYYNEQGVITDQGKELLADDTMRLARSMSLYRGVSQAILPGTAIYRWMIEQNDTKTDVVQVAASLDFQRMMDENGQDFGAATREFEDTYGTGSLLMLIGKYDGDFSPTSKASEYFDHNEGDLTAHRDVAGLFFPYDGTYSPSFDAELRRKGMKVQRDPEEMMEYANQYRYYSIKARLQEKVDSGIMTTEAMNSEMKRLSEEFGVTYNQGIVKNKKDMIRQIKEAVADEKSNLKDTDAGIATTQYLALREQAMTKVEDAGITLSNKRAVNIRKWLAANGEALVAQHPDFARLWNNVLSSEVQ